MDDYIVPGLYGKAEYVEKRSRFIGQVWRVTTPEEAAEKIAAVREEYWDATHNVHAWILRNGASRCTDDGEPKGTAGMPTLDVFRKGGVSDVLCVVTRYFGGTLLGAGGLVRAYGKAASMALETAGLYRMQRFISVQFSTSYTWYESAKLRFESLGGTVSDTAFAADVTVTGLLPEGFEQDLEKALSELTAGKVRPLFLGETLMPGKIE